MASNEEREDTAPRGNEWEVVSLTQSAYAASPGPKQVDPVDDSSAEYVAETSNAMLMSGHFVFPPNEHENLQMEQDKNEIPNEKVGEDATPEFVSDKGGKSDKHEESAKSKVKSSLEFPGIQIFDDMGKRLSISDPEFEEDAALQGLISVDKDQNFLGAANYSSLHSEEPMSGSVTTEEGNVLAESVEPFHQSLHSDIPNSPKDTDEDKSDAENLPCQAWWKRRVASLIAHAKDADAFWSLFIAAAVMGFVIIGQTWQQERWQALQMKWKFGVHDERTSWMFGPISRLKDVIVGGDRRGSLIRGSPPAQR